MPLETGKFWIKFKKKKNWESNLNIIPGSGQFGEVFHGTLRNEDGTINKNVAIKLLRNRENMSEFYKEAFAASQMKHENIVEFIG